MSPGRRSGEILLPSHTEEALAEARDVRASLSALLGGGTEKPRREDEVWRLYAKCERLAATLKFRLRVERPGVFLKLPRSDEPEAFLPLALSGLDDALLKFEAGDELGALDSIRQARTYLRAYLSSRQRLRMRAKRRASSAKASSPS
ncbi:MAG: hypothetical protein JRN09_01810 [Nitrososphaerota archaeon]|nr:hypothetical protein [Nitrososphaerota archaeon]